MSTLEKSIEKSIELQKAEASVLKSIQQLEKATDTLKTLSIEAGETAFEIEKLEFKKGQLEQELDNKARENAADLRLRIKENEDTELTKLLEARGLAQISLGEVVELSKTTESLREEADKAFETGMAKGIEETDSKYLEEKLTISATHKVEVAEKDALIKTLESKVAFLETANKTLHEALDAERVARVTIASSTNAPVINVGN